MATKKRKATAPATGDRIDFSGKVPQFKSFALYAYRELVDENLEWIRIADPAALKLDDIQFATKLEIKAYQVKWSTKAKPTPFTFSEFIKLFPHLCQGYRALKKEHKNLPQRLKAHLLTNRPFSKNDSIKNNGSKILGSFSEFHSQVWYHLKNRQPEQIDKKWLVILKKLEKASGLSPKEYKEFIDNFEIVTDDLKKLEQKNRPQDRQLIRDVNEFFLFLLDEVKEVEGPVEIQANAIVSKLNWDPRITTIFNHEFIVDATSYQPIRPTITELNQKVKSTSSGYLYLKGSPGSGKSSLLTTWMKGRQERFIRYYAYTNQSPGENRAGRGESTSLFFDLVLQLRKKKIWDQKTLPYKEDAEGIRQAFHDALELLHQEYIRTGIKTIFLIDGLDHLPREYKPNRSFLADLPAPAAIPEGVIIILGSQSYELEHLTNSIRNDITEDRLISMKPIPAAGIDKLIDRYKLQSKLLPKEKKEIVRISQGHPLYLTYILKFLSAKIPTTSMPALLASIPGYDGDIEKYYNSFWIELQTEAALTAMLGLLARIKGAVLPTFIMEWGIDQQILQTFRSKAIHFFDTSDDGWAIFHNSFRQFLIQKTAINPLTQSFDHNLHKKFHKRLAAYYQASEVELHWKCLYHLNEAEEYDEVLRIGTPEYFTDQFFQFRPFDQIEAEIRAAIKIADKKDDPQVLIRYLLSLLEMQTRDGYIRSASFCEEFIQMDELKWALPNLMENDLSLVNENFGLDTSLLLYRAGHAREASKLFALSIPEEVQEKGIKLNETDPMRRRDQTLRKWVTIAVQLEPLPSILARIGNITEKHVIKKELRIYHLSKERIKRQLYMDAAVSLIATNREKDFKTVMALLPTRVKENIRYWFAAMNFAAGELDRSNQRLKAELLLQTLIQKSKKLILLNDEKIFLASTAFRLTRDKKLATNILKGVEGPEPVKPDELDHDGNLDVFYPLFLYHKLRWLTGAGQPAVEAIPASAQSNEIALVEFKRTICRLAKINAEAHASTLKPVTLLRNELIPLIRFFYKGDIFPTYRDLYSRRIGMMVPEYLKMLVDSVCRYGKPYLEMLKELIESEMNDYPLYWNADSRRAVLMAFYDNEVEKDWIFPKLRHIEEAMLNKGDITERVEQCKKQAEAWVKIGEKEAALNFLKNTLKQSFGVGYSKDYQLEIWIEWMEKVNEVDSANAARRITWLASRLYLVKQTSERSTAFDAGIALLRCTLAWNLSAGIRLFQWMLEKELVPFERSLKKVMIALIRKSDKKIFLHLFRFCTKVLFKFLDRYSIDLLRSILEKANKSLTKAEQTKLLGEIMQGINIHILPEYRSEFILDVADLAEELKMDISSVQGLSSETGLKRKDPINYSPLVIRKKGKDAGTESLDKAEVIARVRSFKDFIDLKNQEDGWNSYFDWGEVIAQIPGLKISDLNNFYNSDLGAKRKSTLNICMSKMALQMGDKTLALAFAKRALDESSEYGWSIHYDGGTRLLSFQALINAGADNARKSAFTSLTNDAITYSDLRSLLPHFDEILPVISDKFDTATIWVEIERYMQKLLANAEPMTDLPILDGKPAATKQLFDDLLVYLLDSPVDVVSVNVRNFIITDYAIS